MSTQRLSKAGFLACVILPTAAVVLAREVFPGAGPRSAAASINTGAPNRPGKHDEPLAPRTPQDSAKALAAINDLRSNPVGPSPFVSQVPRALTKIVMTTPEVVQTKAREFSLTSIAGGSRQSIAMIDGTVRRVGDDLGDGWTVSVIEHASGTVVLTGPDGLTHTLTLRK